MTIVDITPSELQESSDDTDSWSRLEGVEYQCWPIYYNAARRELAYEADYERLTALPRDWEFSLQALIDGGHLRTERD